MAGTIAHILDLNHGKVSIFLITKLSYDFFLKENILMYLCSLCLESFAEYCS